MFIFRIDKRLFVWFLVISGKTVSGDLGGIALYALFGVGALEFVGRLERDVEDIVRGLGA